MKKLVFESRLLPDGHLYCPEELAHEENAIFKVVVTFRKTNFDASDHEIESASVNDISEDFLTKEDVNYYLNLKDLYQTDFKLSGYKTCHL